jgi:MFS family permease
MNLLPAWAVNVLHGDVRTNGLLLSARGLGAMAGALLIASLGRTHIKGKLWTLGTFLIPTMLVLFALSRWLPLSLLILVGFGMSQIIMFNTSNALVQLQVPDELRGRVMSIFILSFFGFMPLGSLLLGALADRLSEPLTVLICGLILLAYAGWVWLTRPFIRKLE